MRRKDALGRHGEQLAAAYLQQQGMSVVERNWRCELGELDVIARDQSVLVICEVKTRSSVQRGHPFEAISERKVRRLRRLAIRWLEERAIHAPSIRFDVIGVIQPAAGPASIEHIRGVD